MRAIAGEYRWSAIRHSIWYDGAFMDIYQVIRGEKNSDFSHEHDLAVQKALLEACRLPLK